LNIIEWLEDWYLSQCNGDWEHSYYGLKISTLDNPGWSVKINLQETILENKSFESLVKERTEHDWIHCRLKEVTLKDLVVLKT
jgi:hypothetical protein